MQVSLDKFRRKFRSHVDRPTVLGVSDRMDEDGVVRLPLYATAAFLEVI